MESRDVAKHTMLHRQHPKMSTLLRLRKLETVHSHLSSLRIGLCKTHLCNFRTETGIQQVFNKYPWNEWSVPFIWH
jgi:hypothetical protein